jgi:hypothetical protein
MGMDSSRAYEWSSEGDSREKERKDDIDEHRGARSTSKRLRCTEEWRKEELVRERRNETLLLILHRSQRSFSKTTG